MVAEEAITDMALVNWRTGLTPKDLAAICFLESMRKAELTLVWSDSTSERPNRSAIIRMALARQADRERSIKEKSDPFRGMTTEFGPFYKRVASEIIAEGEKRRYVGRAGRAVPSDSGGPSMRFVNHKMRQQDFDNAELIAVKRVLGGVNGRGGNTKAIRFALRVEALIDGWDG